MLGRTLDLHANHPMLATYHNHTTWSDGKAHPNELLQRAAQLGIDELGVSDHCIHHPQGNRYPWGMTADQLANYVDNLRALRDRAQRTTNVAVRIGVEVDWFAGCADALRRVLDQHAFDYLIGSVHEVDGFIVDTSPSAWEKLSEEQRNTIHRGYWLLMRELAESRLFDIAAHLDLTKKFDQYPTIDITAERHAALDAIAKADLVVELNTAGWHKPCRDAYPSLDILRECRARDIPVTLSADAHQADHLLRDFARGSERLRAAGYTEVVRFSGRERTFESLDDVLPRT